MFVVGSVVVVDVVGVGVVVVVVVVGVGVVDGGVADVVDENIVAIVVDEDVGRHGLLCLRQREQYVVPVSLGNAKNAYATRKIYKVDLYLSNKTLHNFPRHLRRFLGTR